jgi:acetyl esterase/lipase
MLASTPGFNPTYLPPNTTAEDIQRSGGITVQAALLSYPALDVYQLCKTGFETAANPFWMMADQKHRRIFADSISYKRYPALYKAVSPMYQIPSSTQRKLPPQFCMVGSMDVVTPASTIKSYVEKCRLAGQPIEFWEYKGRPHAFLDSKKNPFLGIDFSRDAPLAIDQMITFLNNVFYNQLAHHE